MTPFGSPVVPDYKRHSQYNHSLPFNRLQYTDKYTGTIRHLYLTETCTHTGLSGAVKLSIEPKHLKCALKTSS